MTTSIKASRRSVLSALASSTLLVAAAVGAQSAHADEPVLTKTVVYADINLESEKGAQVLLARLRGAARQVCAPLASADLGMRAHWRTCFDTAVADAVAKVNSKALSALYSQTHPQPRG